MPSSGPDAPPPLWRHLLAVGLLPLAVTIAIPAALIALHGTRIGWGLPGALGAIPVLAGVAAIVGGLRLAQRTIVLFRAIGEGTLAPWDPTGRLVASGPYRRVRNPMITGVGMILIGQAVALGSPAILVELGIFALANALWIPLVEEPGLAARFGADWERYRRAVPRWVPRRRPWDGSRVPEPPRPSRTRG